MQVLTASTYASPTPVRLGDLVGAVRQVRAASIDSDSEPHRRQILEFCAAHPDALHRSCHVGHLTGSTAVLERETGRLALLFHAKVQRWLQPGGHADGDGDLTRVAWREATEETGVDDLDIVAPAIDLDVHTFRARGEREHLHFDVRSLALAARGTELVRNHESSALRWFGLAEVERLDLDAGLRRLLRRARTVASELGAI